MADDDLTDEEREIIRKRRAANARRKVTIRGKHAASGSEYEFDIHGEDAERVIRRHASLFAEDDADGKDGKDTQKKGYFKGAQKQE